MSGTVEAYQRSVNCLLDDWQALSMVVAHSFGGQYSLEKADWLKGVICEFLTSQQSARSADEVEDYLASLMDQEFDTIVEDGSIAEISRQLIKLWHEWKASNELPAVAKLKAPQPTAVTESTIDNEREKTAENKAEDDDDGWTVVSRRR